MKIMAEGLKKSLLTQRIGSRDLGFFASKSEFAWRIAKWMRLIFFSHEKNLPKKKIDITTLRIMVGQFMNVYMVDLTLLKIMRT